MMAGSRLSCIGIIGDGCGGGREFIVEDGTLVAHDPQTDEDIVLLQDIKHPTSISKKGCIITLTCREEIVEFDLSSMKQIIKKV